MISKATIGPSASSASQAPGCNCPNQPTTVFGPNCSVAERPGCRNAGPPGTTCTAFAFTPSAERSVIASRLASKTSTSAAAAPVPAFPVRLGPAAPHRCGRDALVVFARAEKDLPDLEQRDVAQGPAGVALGGGDETRNEARAHVGEVGCDRIGERERRRRRRRTVPPRLWRRTTRSPPRAAKARPACAWRAACASA